VNCFVIGSAGIIAMLPLTLLSLLEPLGANTDQNAGVDRQICTIVRMQPTGMLMNCGAQVRSLQLTMEDISRTVRFTPDGLFHFNCPIDMMCDRQPRIDGWMILKEVWESSNRDEDAIVKMLRLPPAVRGPGYRGPGYGAAGIPAESQKSVCGTFPINIAGMNGRAACYEGADTSPAVIAVIASGPQLGFAILFSQFDSNWKTLRDRVIELAPRFKLERAAGDIKLMKWLR
jgi:hypothetical protein